MQQQVSRSILNCDSGQNKRRGAFQASRATNYKYRWHGGCNSWPATKNDALSGLRTFLLDIKPRVPLRCTLGYRITPVPG